MRKEKSKIRIRLICYLAISVALGFTSCSEDDTPSTQQVNSGVYVVGSGKFGGGNSMWAKLWENGVPSNLSDGVSETYVNSVFVTNSDVYVAGNVTNAGGVSVATLWKNGIATALTDGTISGSAYQVIVSNGIVYVLGRTSGEETTIWIDGKKTTIAGIYGYSFYISNDIVYVVGMYRGDAILWKAGSITALSDPANNYSEAVSVFVSGNDVYACGSINYEVNYTAIMWKNGIATDLIERNTESEARSVFVSGSDVYVAGTIFNGNYNTAILWKNGKATDLSVGNPGFARSVFVSGSDVYVVGSIYQGIDKIAVLWKNGVITKLENGSNMEAADVFVK